MGEALTLPQRTAHITDEAVCHCLSGRDCHQQYCSAPVCRAASNAASQARWLAKPENQGYFRGPENVARVQAWRSPHPGYWRGVRRTGAALQEASPTQPVDSTALKTDLTRSPLQDVLTAQPAVLIGLIAHIVGTPLQDDIVRATGRLLRLGQHILAYPRRRQQCPRPTGIVD